jgi:hypothetical protein
MSARSVLGLLLAVLLAVSAIELSSWVLGHAVSAIVPSASVSEVNAEMPQAPEVDAAAPGEVPALTW